VYSPNLAPPDILGSLLLQEGTDLLQLAATRAGIVQQVREFAGVGLNLLDALLEPGVAFQDQDLVLGPT